MILLYHFGQGCYNFIIAGQNVSIKEIGSEWKEITISDIAVTNGTCQVGIYSDGQAGNWVKVDDFSLIGKATPVEPYKINDGKYMQDITVHDTANETAWSLSSSLKSGDVIFGDRTFKFAQVPDSLIGAEVLRTACNSKKFTSAEASFRAGADIMAYVGVDERVTSKQWLADWTKTAETMTDDGDPIVTYRIYKKAFKQGETVSIGVLDEASVVNYVVAAKAFADDTTRVDATVPGQKYLRGDLNFDGIINAFDLTCMKRLLLNGTTDVLLQNIADVSANGIFDVEDVKMLNSYILVIIKQFPELYYTAPETAVTSENARQMEYLDRGISAVSTGSSAFVSWRTLASDPADAGFNVYRTTDGKTVKVNSEVLYGGTNYTDTTANLAKSNKYTIKMVQNSKEVDTDGSDTLAANAIANCDIIPIKSGSKIHFVWTGDLNGDGTYDFLVDRPSDDHQKLEAYLNDGTYLWTLDCGVNSENKNTISPGSSAIDVGMWDGATVYDIDCDGYAEVIVRISDGVILGNGKVYSNNVKNGQVIAVLDGKTGALEATAPVPDDYISIGPVACMMQVGYLDGISPSIVCWYKNRNSDKTFNSMTCAYTYTNGKFGLSWKYDNKILFDDRLEYKNGYAEAHQIRVVDVDSNGKDEVLHQGYALNGDGTLRYHMNEIVHGDRWFVGAFSNKDNGRDLMGYGIQQDNASGLLEYYYNASTGKIIWKNQTTDGSTYDVGRGNVGDIDPNYDGFECFSFQGTWSNAGKKIYSEYEYPCLRLWWDGDLLSEQYNDTKIEKWNYKNKTTDRLLSPWKVTDCVGSDRGAPMFYGDIYGDWREEVIMTSSDYSKLVIFSTTNETTTRLYSLAQNPCYRNCMTAKGYYQSHMLDFYLGSGMTMPKAPNISIIQK